VCAVRKCVFVCTAFPGIYIEVHLGYIVISPEITADIVKHAIINSRNATRHILSHAVRESVSIRECFSEMSPSGVRYP